MPHDSPFSAKLMRARGLLKKESLQIMRDPSSIALALVMPVVLLVLFGYGVTFDAQNITAAVVLDDRGPEAMDYYGEIEGSRYFLPRRAATLGEARAMLTAREVSVIFHVRSDFGRTLAATGTAPVQAIVDAVDANRGRLIAGYAEGITAAFNGSRQTGSSGGRAVLDERVWFNAELDSQNSLVPGLLALIMTLTGILLTALVYVRERERGTLEALLVTPVRPVEIMMSKLVPYFVLGMAGLVVTVLLSKVLFGVPLRGSWWVLLLASSLFMGASLGVGLLISVAAPNQMVASQASIIAGFLPAFFLSGLIFDLQAQPWWTNLISNVIPTTYFINAARTLFLAGDVWATLRPDLLVLAGMAVLLLALARLRIRKRLS